MSAVIIVIISDLLTLLLSMGVTIFIAGTHWGEIRTDLNKLKDDVAQIKGMFVPVLRRENRGE